MIRTNLKHKPVVTVEDYPSRDGKYANNTDVQYLTLGLAQWNKPYNVSDISAKVWRINNENKISRQSEELPLHRVIDLTTFIVDYQIALKNNSQSKVLIDDSQLGEIKDVTYEESNEAIHNMFNHLFEEEFKEQLEPRLKHLSSLLKELGY